MPDDELLSLMCDTITIAPPSGTYSDRGQPSFGAAVSYPCRIEPASGEEIVRGPNAEERKASWRIYVGSTSALDPEGQLTLPAGFSPQTPPFFSIGRMADEVGSHHSVILV